MVSYGNLLSSTVDTIDMIFILGLPYPDFSIILKYFAITFWNGLGWDGLKSYQLTTLS